MPKTKVTDALYAYLAPENSAIPYLGKVYTALPKVGNEQDLFSYSFPGVGVGTVIYLFITNQVETRVALGGTHDGRKFREYTLSMLCVMKSELDESEDGQSAFNEFIDGLTGWIEADRTAGTSADSTGPYAGTGLIFQWGEGGINEGPDIHIEYPVPRTINGQTMIFQAVVRVNVCEVLQI